MTFVTLFTHLNFTLWFIQNTENGNNEKVIKSHPYYLRTYSWMDMGLNERTMPLTLHFYQNWVNLVVPHLIEKHFIACQCYLIHCMHTQQRSTKGTKSLAAFAQQVKSIRVECRNELYILILLGEYVRTMQWPWRRRTVVERIAKIPKYDHFSQVIHSFVFGFIHTESTTP